MSNVFNTQRLAGQRVLVTGSEPEQQQILYSDEWDDVKHLLAHRVADDAFNSAVEEFFAPLVEAATAAEQELLATLPAVDDAFTVVISEGTEAVEGEDPQIITLSRETAILRMIEEGKTDRLIWVGSSIEILAA